MISKLPILRQGKHLCNGIKHIISDPSRNSFVFPRGVLFHDRRSKGSETEGKTKLDVSKRVRHNLKCFGNNTFRGRQ